MTTYDYFGGGLTVREEMHTVLESLGDNYLTTANFAIQTQEYCSVYNLVGLTGAIDGQGIQVASFYNDATGMDVPAGGGFFLWDSTKAKSSHNGVTVISPTVPWTGTQATLSSFIAGTGETDASGNGCWVRQYNQLDVMMGGAVSDGSTSDLVAFQSVVDVLPDSGTHVIHVPAGSYAGTLSSISLSNRKIIWLEQGAVTYVSSNPTGYRKPDSVTYVNSIKDIVGLSGTARSQQVQVANYYPWTTLSRRPLGGGSFFWDSSKAKSAHDGITIFSPTVPWDGTSATLSDYQTKVGETDPSGSGCWVRQYINLDIFMGGAVAGLATGFDNAPVINRCLAVSTSSGVSVVHIPDETIYVNSTIENSSNNRHLIGAGYRNTRLYRNGNYGDTISFHGTSATGTLCFDCSIRGFKIESAAATTTGAHLKLSGLARIVLDDIYTINGYIHLQAGGINGTVTRLKCENENLFGEATTGRKYIELGNAGGSYAHQSVSDLFFHGINLRSGEASHLVEYDIDILSADGAWFLGGHTGYSTGACIRFNPTGTDDINLVWFSDFMTDRTSGYGVYFDGNTTGVYNNIFFNNCNFKGGVTGGTSAIATSANCTATSVHFTGGSAIQYNQNGVQINSPDFRHIHFNEFVVRGNSKSSLGTYAGYKFANNTRDIYISGGSSGGDDNSATDPDMQSYGIEGGTGHSNIYVRGTDLRKNVTSAINVAPGNGIYLIGCPTSDGVSTSTIHSIISVADNTNSALRAMQSGTANTAEFGRYANDANASVVRIAKSRNATAGSHTIINSGDEIGRISFEGSNGTGFDPVVQIRALCGATPGASGDMPGTLVVLVTPDGSATPTERYRINNQGFLSITGSLGLGAPVIKTGDFTVAASENFLINNKSGSACVVNLPSASSFSGRIILFLNYQAQAINSSSSNVVPITGGAAGTAIVAATAGKNAWLVSDGTNWIIWDAN